MRGTQYIGGGQYLRGETATVKNGYTPSMPLQGGKRISFGFALPKVRGNTTPTISVCKLNLRGLTTGYVAYQGGAYVSGGYDFKSVAVLASASGDNNVMIQLNFSSAQVGSTEMVSVEIDDIQITF